MSARFHLGQRVRITGTVCKQKSWRGGSYSPADITYAEGGLPVRYNYPEPKTYDEGVIVGSRTIMDGTASWEDAASMYNPTSGTARNVWLVAFDMRMKPVMCFDDQVEPLDPRTSD